MATAGAPVAHAPVPSQSQSGVNFTIAYDDSDMRTEMVDAADDPGASSAPPSASRRRDEPEQTDADAPRCTPVTSSALFGLRADVLACAEGAMRGDEVAAVSAMVTATETAALREALGGAGASETAAASQGETRAAATAVVFGARRRLGLEVGEMDAPEVFGVPIPRGVSEATEAPSSWPGSASALAALGYSEAGWESAGKSAAAENTATEPENEWRAPGDVASQPATSRAARAAETYAYPVRSEPTPSNADVAVDHAVTLEDEDDPAPEREDDEDEDEDPGDWATGGTQIETVPTEEASDDDAGADSLAATPEEDVGGTQIAPEEEDGDVPKPPSPASPAPRPSPAPSRSPVGPPPSFLRLASKPAATLPRRLSSETPAAETPGSLWTAAAASAGFKTPPGPGPAREDGASAKVAVAATSPFPLSAPAAKADKAEVVPETAAAPSESEKTAPRETATKPVEPVPPPSVPGPSVLSDPSDGAERAERAETGAPPTFPGGTPAEVMCSYIPSTFPQSKAPTLTESSAGGEAAPVEAVAAAAAAAAEEEEVPLSEVPLSVAMSPGAKPLGATGGALAAAMRARRRRHELAAAGASMSLGPPADDAEPPPPARADVRASAFASRPEAPSGPSFDLRATSAPDTSHPGISVASHASRMVVEATPGDAFTPFDLTVADDDAEDAGGVGPSRDAQTRPDDVAEARRRSENPAESDPGSASLDHGGAEGKGWAGGWGRVAGARRGDRAAPPRDAGGVNRREDPTQESPEEEEEDARASPDFCLMLSQQVRDVIADAAAEAPSQNMPPPPRRPSSSAAGAPKPRRQSSIAAQARMQRLWDEKEARDAAGAAARRSKRRRKPRKFFGDSQFPSQSQGDEEEEDAEEDDDAVEESDEDEDLSDPEDDSEEEKSEGETGTTPLAKRRAPRLRKPRRFFGDSQFPSQSQGDEEEEEAEEDDDADEGEEEDDEALEICESDEDEAPWYVGGTQAVPDVPGDADDDEDDEDAPLPPMLDEDEADDDDEADASVPPHPAKRVRRASARVAAAPKPAAKKTPTKSKTPAKRAAKKNPEWRGPLPKLGCPKCRHAAKGCGRCRAIRAHAEFGTPLPWRAKTVGGARGAPSSAPPATRGGRRVRFDDESEQPNGRASGSAGAKRRRVSASAAARSSLSSMGASVAPSRRASASSARNALSANANALALAAGRTSDEGKVSPASRRRFRRVSNLFEGSTFLLSGIPSKGEVDELTELLETHGGVVRRDVPPPAPPRVASADLYQPSQDVGAPMRRDAPGSNTIVLTPAAGRTLKCLYAAAVGAPLVSPDWVRDCVEAGSSLALEPYRMSRRAPLAGRDGDDGDGDLNEYPDATRNAGGVFDGVVVSLSGDAHYARQFGVLLRHAGADVVDAADLIAAEGQDVPMGEGPCDYVLVQTAAGAGAGAAAKRKGLEGGLARAAKRLGVPRVRHEWAVDSLLANRLEEMDETYRL